MTLSRKIVFPEEIILTLSKVILHSRILLSYHQLCRKSSSECQVFDASVNLYQKDQGKKKLVEFARSKLSGLIFGDCRTRSGLAVSQKSFLTHLVLVATLLLYSF